MTSHTECTLCQDADLGVVFGHDCPNDIRKMGRLPRVATRRSDNVDAPEGNGTGRRHGHDEGASEAQVRYLISLGCPADEANRLSKAAASQRIDALLKAKATQPEAPQAERPNRYAGRCVECGQQVAAMAGTLVRTASGWSVRHQDECPPAFTGPVVWSEAEQSNVAAGHYAIPSTGANDLAFYRVDRPTKGTYAGRTFVKLVVGGQPDHNVARSQVEGILARIAADPQAAARYGQEIGRCCRCNRHLTDEASRAAGIGPECAKAS